MVVLRNVPEISRQFDTQPPAPANRNFRSFGDTQIAVENRVRGSDHLLMAIARGRRCPKREVQFQNAFNVTEIEIKILKTVSATVEASVVHRPYATLNFAPPLAYAAYP
jgi:hypothetical protein